MMVLFIRLVVVQPLKFVPYIITKLMITGRINPNCLHCNFQFFFHCSSAINHYVQELQEWSKDFNPSTHIC